MNDVLANDRPDEHFDYIIYHSPCHDGLTAAWVVHKLYPDARFHPTNYNIPIPELTDKNIIIVDFSYSRLDIETLRSKNKRVLIIDHHKTAEANLSGLDDCIFDMDKSGAELTWEYFHNTAPPDLVKYVGDYDL